MKKLSVSDISKRYDIPKRTIQNHFKDGIVRGEKDVNGHWMAEEKDAENFYKKPDPREWLHIDYCINHSPYSRGEILDAVDEGQLDSTENFWGIHIHYEKWNKNMAKVCCDNEKCLKIKDGLTAKIINKCGIHNRPTALIAQIMMNYPSVKLYLCYQRKFHSLDRRDLALFLPSLGIANGEQVVFKAEGPKKDVRTVLHKIRQLVTNGFYIDKAISSEKLLSILS